MAKLDWLPDIAGTSGPLYRRIADALARDVERGALRPGTRLPPHRALAASLGVDLTTVTRALAEAAGAGLVVSEGRRGTFVRARHAAPEVDLPGQEAASGMNMPPEPEGGSLRQRLAEGYAALLGDRTPPLHYQPAGGTEAQRAAVAGYLSGFVPDAVPDQCVVTAGSQHALHALLSLLLAPGDRIAAGAFAFPGFLGAARRLGAQVVPLAMDEDGILPEALEAAAQGGGLRALYVVPTNDNPTTATLPLARRRRIAELARAHGFTVVEDDAYGRLPRAPMTPIAALAPELTWHITTTSKLLAPALRVGFVRAPSVRDALALAAATHDTAGMAPPLNAALVARWLDDGTFERLLEHVRGEAEARMAEAAATLTPFGARFQPEGYHLWLPLGAGLAAGEIAARAVAIGLPAVAGTAFAVEPDSAPALRISLGGSASRHRVRREIERLAAMLDPASTPARAVI